MIERLPLEIFGGDQEPDAETKPSSSSPELDTGTLVEAAESETAPPVTLARCQWCAAEFDDALGECPHCGAVHLRADPAEAQSTTVTCQWCLTEFEAELTTCPVCHAMAVIPGQYIPGEDEPMPDFASRGKLAQRAQSHQLLVGMMAGGGLDALAAGLIGLAFTLFDND
jgi:hypothetical protein